MSHKAIGTALSKLYQLFLDIGAFEPGTICFPHATPKGFVEACQEAGFDQSAIDLFQALPWSRANFYFISDGTACVEHPEADNVKFFRVPPYFEEEPNLPDSNWPTLPASYVPISTCTHRDGSCMFIDAHTGKLYHWAWMYEDIKDVEGEDAVEFFETLIDELRAHDFIPFGNEYVMREYEGEDGQRT